MALRLTMEHKETKLTKRAYLGWSWTSLFFGPLPALFRGDWWGAAAWLALCPILFITTAGVGNLLQNVIWAFLYNRWHARRLIAAGYKVRNAGAYMRPEEATLLLGAEL